MSSISPEREEELIEKFLKLVVERNMETIAIFYLKGSTPLLWTGSQLAKAFVFPYLSIFTGVDILSEDILTILGNRKNVGRIIDRLQILSEERENKKKMLSEKKSSVEIGYIQRIREFIKKIFI